MLSVPKKVHPLVLSVFFLRFFFFQPHARPWVKRETKKKSALRVGVACFGYKRWAMYYVSGTNTLG